LNEGGDENSDGAKLTRGDAGDHVDLGEMHAAQSVETRLEEYSLGRGTVIPGETQGVSEIVLIHTTVTGGGPRVRSNVG